MEKQSNFKEMCEDYKQYRHKEGEKLSKMTPEERVIYMQNLDKNVKELAQKNGAKTISFDDLLGGKK